MMAMMASSARSLPYAAARARPVHLLAHSSVSSRGLRQAAAGGPPLAAAQALPLPHRSFASEAAATPEARIKEILEERFPDGVVNVEDTSGGCGSFYAIQVTSGEFVGKPMIKQHRLVQEALKAEIAEMHGLNIKTAKPK